LERIYRLKAYEKANDVCILIPEYSNLKTKEIKTKNDDKPTKRVRASEMLEMAIQEEG